MERRRKIWLLISGIVLLVIGLMTADPTGVFSDLFDAWHWQMPTLSQAPESLQPYLVDACVISIPIGLALLITWLALAFYPSLKLTEQFIVTLACIILLVAFIFPIIAKAREKNGHSNCANNQRQIAVGLQIYAQDNNGQLPLDWAPAIKLAPMTFICPTTRRRFHPLGGFGYNGFLAGKYLEDIDDPTTQLLTMDAKLMTSVIHSPEDISRRHDGFFIASYLDGHTGLVKDGGKARLLMRERKQAVK